MKKLLPEYIRRRRSEWHRRWMDCNDMEMHHSDSPSKEDLFLAELLGMTGVPSL